MIYLIYDDLTVLEFGLEAKKPLYDSYCVSNIANSILSVLSVQHSGPELPNDVFEGVNNNVQNVVLFVFDGFGYNEWERQNGNGFFGAIQSKGRIKPITTVFPSTTSTALTSIATGLTPQEHSLIEWYLYVQELDMIIQTLPFSPMGTHESDLLLPTADPSLLFEGETMFGRLKREGVAVDSLIPKHVASRSYSKLAYGQSRIHAYESVSDLSVILRRTLESRTGPSLTYVYYDKVDTVEHSYGPNTEEAFSEANLASYALYQYLLNKLNKNAAKNALFLATADHGHIANTIKNMRMLNDIPRFESYLANSVKGNRIPPWGAPRDVYLRVNDDILEEAFSILSEELEPFASVIRTRDAVDSGLFGRGNQGKKFLSRVGNLMILPRNKNLVWYKFEGVNYPAMLGHHGGVHRDEMTVPFAVANAGDLVD